MFTLEKKQDQTSPALFTENLEMTMKTISDVNGLHIPNPNGALWFHTDKSINTFDMVAFLATKIKIKKIYASTYSLAQKTVENLVNLYDAGIIDEVTLLISESMIKRNPITIENLVSMANSRDRMTVKYAWTHAKVTLLEAEEGYFVLEGSGNWSRNAHMEQYVLVNSPEVYRHRMEMFESVKVY